MNADEAIRLREAWEASPTSSSTVAPWVRHQVRRGDRRGARETLVASARAGIEAGALAPLSQGHRLGVWSGHAGAWPHRTWLGSVRSDETGELRRRWWYRARKDQRFGLPPAVIGDRIALVGQSLVVGMRFVDLVILSADRGEPVAQHEERDVMAPLAPLPVSHGGRDAIAWIFARPVAHGIELWRVIYDAESGERVAEGVEVLDDALILSGQSAAVPLPDGGFAWGFRYRTSEREYERIAMLSAAGELVVDRHIDVGIPVLAGGETHLVIVSGEALTRVSYGGRGQNLVASLSPPRGVELLGHYAPHAVPTLTGEYLHLPEDRVVTSRGDIRRDGLWRWCEGAGISELDVPNAQILAVSATGRALAGWVGERGSLSSSELQDGDEVPGSRVSIAGLGLESGTLLSGIAALGERVLVARTSVGQALLVRAEWGASTPATTRVSVDWHGAPFPVPGGLGFCGGSGVSVFE